MSFFQRLFQRRQQQQQQPQMNRMSEEQCYYCTMNKNCNPQQCFLTQQELDSMKGYVGLGTETMKQVLNDGNTPVKNAMECNLIAKFGNKCEGENEYRRDDNSCPVFSFLQREMINSKPRNEYFADWFKKLEAITNVNELRNQIRMFVCELDDKDFAEVRTRTVDILTKLVRNRATAERVIDLDRRGCASTMRANKVMTGECWVGSDKVLNDVMEQILTGEVGGEGTLYVTSVLGGRDRFNTFMENANDLAKVRNNIVAGDKFRDENESRFTDANIKAIINSSLTGESVKESQRIMESIDRQRRAELLKKTNVAIKQFENSSEVLLNTLDEQKKKIETFIGDNSINRRIQLNNENYNMKVEVSDTMTYVLIGSVLLAVFIGASSLNKK